MDPGKLGHVRTEGFFHILEVKGGILLMPDAKEKLKRKFQAKQFKDCIIYKDALQNIQPDLTQDDPLNSPW